MNQLYEVYAHIKAFAENHNMVQSFHLLNAPEQIDELDSEFPRLIMILDSFSLDDNSYTVSFGLIVQDAVVAKDYMMEIKAQEGAINVLGQLEEYLYAIGKNIEFSNGAFAPSFVDSRNRSIVTSYATLSVVVERILSEGWEWEEGSGIPDLGTSTHIQSTVSYLGQQGALLIVNRLNEFDTEQAKMEARQNIGLQNINLGTFY